MAIIDPNVVFLMFEMDGTPIGLLPERSAQQPSSRDGRAGLKGNLMATKKNEGAFAAAPEQPFNNYLSQLAQARAEEDGTDLVSAMGKVKMENRPLADAARIEVIGVPAGARGPKFMELMRRALELMKAKGLTTEVAMERVAGQDPDLARLAREERGGSLYATELKPAPGIGDRTVLLAEGLEGALDPGAHLTSLANERRDRKKISFGEALIEVGREHPALVRAARKQSLGSDVD